MNFASALDSLAGATRRRPATALFLLLLVTFGLFNVLPYFREAGHIAEHGQPHTHVRLAAELLKGRLEFSEAFYKDIAIYNGRYYSPFPPFPALFLVPFVAMFGVDLATMALTPLLAALTGVVLFRLLRALGIREAVGLWTTAGFLFGTVYWLTVRFCFDTYFAHVLAVGLVFMAMEAAVSRRSGWWIGLYLGGAFLSRQTTILALPFVWLLRLDPAAPAGSWRPLKPLLSSLPGLAAALGLYCGYNWIRFGSPFESGYAYIQEYSWYLTRMEKWGIQSWAYVPSNFVRLFLQGFAIEFTGPDLMIPTISTSGTSLTFASPFLFFAFRGLFPRRAWLNLAGWGGIVLCAIVTLTNKNGMGGWQINGMRYALDFLPVLLIFAARGMEREADTPYHFVWKGAILYSIALNLLAIALYYLPKFFPESS